MDSQAPDPRQDPAPDPTGQEPAPECREIGASEHSGESFAADETWIQRPNDHLVEPMFSGLGLGAEPARISDGKASASRASWSLRLVLAVALAILIWWLCS